jgi:hypothetical protein
VRARSPSAHGRIRSGHSPRADHDRHTRLATATKRPPFNSRSSGMIRADVALDVHSIADSSSQQRSDRPSGRRGATGRPRRPPALEITAGPKADRGQPRRSIRCR